MESKIVNIEKIVPYFLFLSSIDDIDELKKIDFSTADLLSDIIDEKNIILENEEIADILYLCDKWISNDIFDYKLNKYINIDKEMSDVFEKLFEMNNTERIICLLRRRTKLYMSELLIFHKYKETQKYLYKYAIQLMIFYLNNNNSIPEKSKLSIKVNNETFISDFLHILESHNILSDYTTECMNLLKDIPSPNYLWRDLCCYNGNGIVCNNTRYYERHHNSIYCKKHSKNI